MDLPLQISEPKALLLLLTIPPVVVLGMLGRRARPRDRSRINASIVLRSVILALLALAIAGLQWVSAGGPLTVVFLIDQSASVPKASEETALSYVRDAIADMKPEDRAGVVTFGERAIVARAVQAGSTLGPLGERPSAAATNMADAIQAGLALFPEGGSRKLVLLTDGLETVGQAREQARLAGNAGVSLSVVPLEAAAREDVSVQKVLGPGTLPQGQQTEVRVVVRSTSAKDATVELTDDGVQVSEQKVRLNAGDNPVSFKLTAGKEGFHILTARVTATGDLYAENNSASSFTVVTKPPSVLIVAGSDADATPLREALTAGDISVRVTNPEGLPQRDDNLLQYDAVVLANVSAQAIGIEGQQALQHYVRDLGRGLVMVGGELSFGAGGYLRSPLEDSLPVSMDVRTSEQRASLALAFVTDKSGSMGRCHCGNALQFNPSMRTEFGVSKVEIAKQAIAKAASVLNSTDKVGVVGFDDTAKWLVDMQPMANLGNGVLEDTLKPVSAAGNTNLHAGLQEAVSELEKTDARLKHIILVSDGWTRQGDFSSILNEMDAQNITLSSVGAGQGAADVLKVLAEKGGGRYYAAEDVTSIPDVFLKETVRLVGSYYVEQPFKPQLARASPILNGLDPGSLPSLLGYNGSTIKPNAELVLKSPAGDPILAQWQYGLGRSVAWTPDLKGRWATDWVKWAQFSRFAGHLIGWVLPTQRSPGIETVFSQSQGAASTGQDLGVRVNSVDSTGAPRNFLLTTVAVSSTNGLSATVAALQRSPGVYGATVKDLKQGVYEVHVEQRDVNTGAAVASQTTGFVVPYPSEYNVSPDDERTSADLVADLVQLGNGRRLDVGNPAAAVANDVASQPRPVALWPWLVALAALLFPLDVAVRRLSISFNVLRLFKRGTREA